MTEPKPKVATKARPKGKQYEHKKLSDVKFVKLRAQGATVAEAAKGAGITRQTGYNLMKKDSIKADLAREMDKQGINMESITKGIAEGFKSMAPPRKDGGIQYEDMFTRKQYIDMAIRILGLYAPEELNVNQRVINITITPEVTKGLIDSQALEAEELKEMYDGEGIIDCGVIESVSSENIQAGGSNGKRYGGGEEEDQGEDRGA